MLMDTKTAAQLFKALSDPTRLRIISLLQTSSLCVMDIVTILDLPQPTVSRHLSSLKKAALLREQKKGLWHFYAFNHQSPVSKLLQTFLKTNSTSLSELKQDQRSADELRKKGGCCPK